LRFSVPLGVLLTGPPLIASLILPFIFNTLFAEPIHQQYRPIQVKLEPGVRYE
jgi:hypothetical protein